MASKEKLKEEIEVPSDLKETPRQRRFNGRIFVASSFVLALLFVSGIFLYTKTRNAVSFKPTVKTATPSINPSPTLTSSLSPMPEASISSDVSTWKTFTSPNNKFSLKYPSDWIKGAVDTSTNETPINPPPDLSCPHCAGGYYGLSVGFLDNPKSLSLAEFIKEHSYSEPPTEYPNLYGEHFQKNSSSLGLSQEWMIDRNALGAGAHQEFALVNHGDFVITLFCGGAVCSDNFFDQVISTIKFTQ